MPSAEPFSFFSPPPPLLHPLLPLPSLPLSPLPPPPPPPSSTYLTASPQPTHFPPLSILSTLTGLSIFLTGGTGFVGKVIVEKLLRSCPSISRLYLLVRPRKGSTGRRADWTREGGAE